MLEGALSVLRAAHKYGVKRVVMTSSIAAVRDKFPKDRNPDGVPYTEESWSDVKFQKKSALYKMGKTMQERAAWDYVNSLPEKERFEFVTLCPTLLVGKFLYRGQTNTAHEIIRDFFLGVIPPIQSKLSWVCVEDVARAHLQALKVPEAANQRFILNGLSIFTP